jgi:hypothetical protein
MNLADVKIAVGMNIDLYRGLVSCKAYKGLQRYGILYNQAY